MWLPVTTPRQLLRALIVFLSVAIVTAHPAAAGKAQGGEAARLLALLQSAEPDEKRAVSVRQVEIDMGPGTVVIEEGVLVPARPVEGRTLEVAIAGTAWFRFAISDPVESRQLELFTGETALLTPLSRAVLVAADEARLASLLQGDPATGELAKEASATLREWIDSPERQGFATDIALVRSLSGDPLWSGFSAAWCRSPEHRDFYYVLDPSQAESVVLGQFVPLDMKGLDVWEQRWVKNMIRRWNFFGRFADFGIEHPGDWDTWVSSALPSDGGREVVRSFEPEHYALDVQLNPRADRVDTRATAKVRLRAGGATTRAVDFSLSAGARITGVTGEGEMPLDYIRRESALHVFLPEPARPGSVLEVQVSFEGDLLHPVLSDHGWELADTVGWYPRAGRVDRATYEAVFHWPSGIDLVASGRAVASGEGEGRVWERRVLDLPALGFTFELGHYEVTRETIGHVETTFAFPADGTGSDQAVRRAIIEGTRQCLPAFEKAYGSYPLDHLTVVLTHHGFSQGLLSMVTLAAGAMREMDARRSPHASRWAAEVRDLTIAHEISHQWWGNWVGWGSYRDQWLSEALASYSALRFVGQGAESKAALMARNATDWRSSLTAITRDGHSVGSLGPVTLGHRLNSSKSDRAYQAIVYDKGEVVFRMLANALGEEPFQRMLGELARSVANRTIDTPTFVRALEHMSGVSLDAFAAQYIDGTDIPDVYYRYRSEPAASGNGWIIQGEAHRLGGRRPRITIGRNGEGQWTIERESIVTSDEPVLKIAIPFQVVVTPPHQVKPNQPGQVQSARGFGGRLAVTGRTTPFRISVPEKPERLEFDQLGEVLALFHDGNTTPKRTLRMEATDLADAGDREGSMRLLQSALESPVYSERALEWMTPERRKGLRLDELGRAEDARIHAMSARLLIAGGDLEGAERAISAAEGLLDKVRGRAGREELLVLRGKIDLARSDAESAYQRLKVGLERWSFGAEGFGVLAVAAHEAGHARAAERAIRRAESLGVDVRALREARSGISGF